MEFSEAEALELAGYMLWDAAGIEYIEGVLTQIYRQAA